jgi:hypothetical protein
MAAPQEQGNHGWMFCILFTSLAWTGSMSVLQKGPETGLEEESLSSTVRTETGSLWHSVLMSKIGNKLLFLYHFKKHVPTRLE